MIALIFALLFGEYTKFEGRIKMHLSRPVAMSATISNVRIVLGLAPYRHNRMYFKAAVGLI